MRQRLVRCPSAASSRIRCSHALISMTTRWPRWPPRSKDWVFSSGISGQTEWRRGVEEFELIAGERRWRAARRAGLQTIPVLIQVTDEAHSLEQALVENLHRQDLNVLEEASAYQQLIEDFGYTHDQVATRVGKSRTTVTNTLRLLQLPSGVSGNYARARSVPGTPGLFWVRPIAAIKRPWRSRSWLMD